MKLIILTLAIFAIVQSFFLTVVLLVQFKKKIAANYTLLIFLIVNTTVLIRDSLIYFGFIPDTSITVLTEFYWSFTIGQLFYFYIKQVILKESINKKEVFFHFVPLLIISFYWIIVLYLNRNNPDYIPVHYIDEFSYLKAIGLVLYWHMTPIIYFVISLRLLFKHRNSFIENEKKYICWMIYAFFLVNMISMFILFLSGSYPFVRGFILPSSILIISTLTVLLSYIILNKGFQLVQSKLYKPERVDVSFVETLMKDLERLMNEKTFFTTNAISLNELAKKLGTNSNYLSTSINQYHNLSFNDFINKKRIDFAKKKLLQPESDQFTILSIALDSGFKSKDAFYRAFKKFTGKTPTEFKKMSSV